MITGSAGMLALDRAQQFGSVDAWHTNIGHQNLWRVVLKLRQHFLPATERLAWNVFARECLLQHPPDRAVVVDDPDGFHAAPPGRPKVLTRPLGGSERSERGGLHTAESRCGNGTARAAVGFNHAVMLLDESLRQRQAKTVATVATRDQRKENAVLQRLGNTGAVVDHVQIERQPCLARAIVTCRATRVRKTISASPAAILLSSACAALRTTFSSAWISCSLSPRNSGALAS